MLSDSFLFDFLEPWDIRALSIRKTADLALQLWVDTFSSFVAIRFYGSSKSNKKPSDGRGISD
jgi:hypothetical protein